MMYGIWHGFYTYRSGVREDVPIKPSTDLLSELKSLPSGSSVGIEYSPELVKIAHLAKNNCSIPNSITNYWKTIEQFCKKNGLQVIYLEDVDIYQKYVDKIIGVNKRIKQSSCPSCDSGLYEEQVERDYIFQVEREEALFKAISEKKPTVVILGEGHVKNFRDRQQDLSQSLGIKVRGYKFEQNKIINPFMQNNSSGLFDDEQSLDFDRQFMVRRQYKAVKELRIMPDRTPDFIGYWDVDILARGVFEVYVDKEKDGFCGTIEDIMGTATFRGSLTDNKLRFEKVYDPDKSSMNALHGIITYEAKRICNGSYRGSFHNFPYSRQSGDFSIDKWGEYEDDDGFAQGLEEDYKNS